MNVAALALALSASAAPTATTVGTPFRLHAPDGAVVTDRSFADRARVVLFGFTRCPDVCPTTLAAVAAGTRALGGDADRVRILFISVDPRDTRGDLRRYCAVFSPQAVCLSGNAGEIAATAQAFRAGYSVRPDGNGGFDVSHTGLVYLFGRDGRLLKLLPPAAGAARYTEELRRILALAKGRP